MDIKTYIKHNLLTLQVNPCYKCLKNNVKYIICSINICLVNDQLILCLIGLSIKKSNHSIMRIAVVQDMFM